MKQRVKKFLSEYYSIGRDARLLLTSSGIWSISFGIYAVIWQLYLKAAGYGGLEIGTYSLVQSFSMTLLTIPCGFLADRVKRRGLLVLGGFLGIISTLIILLSVSTISLFISALIGGVSWSISGPAWNALFAETVEESGMEAGYGLSAFLGNICFAIGNILGWIPELMVSKFGFTYFNAYRIFLYLPVLAQIVSNVPLIFVKEKFEPISRGIKLKAGRVALKFIVTSALVGFGAGFSIQLFGYYLSVKFNVESGPIGTLYALSSILGAPAFLASAPISSAIGIVRGVIIPQLISIPLLVLIPFSPNFNIAAALYMPRTMLMNMSNPLLQALMMRLTPEEERGSVSSLSQMAWNLPNAISNRIGGFIMDSVNLDLPIFITSSLYAANLVIFYALFKEEELPKH
jgi:MFS family permease